MVGASTWHRFKTNRKFLKIKSVEIGDSGIFVCKGVNGFGSKSVQIQLVVRGKNEFVSFQNYRKFDLNQLYAVIFFLVIECVQNSPFKNIKLKNYFQ